MPAIQHSAIIAGVGGVLFVEMQSIRRFMVRITAARREPNHTGTNIFLCGMRARGIRKYAQACREGEMKVVKYPNANLRDAPAVLRAIADQVERGDFGDVTEVAVALAGNSLEVFGFGQRQDSTSTHYMLCCAARKLEDNWIGEDRP